MKAKYLAFVIAVALILPAGQAFAGKPTIAGGCKKCHTEKPDAVRGKLKAFSKDFKTMQVEVGKIIWVIPYDDATTTVLQGDKKSGAEEMANLPTDKEVLVSFSGTPAQPKATTVSVKQPYKVPAELLIEIDELAVLIDNGCANNEYTLIDSRPAESYLAGHLPTALSLPYGAFDKQHGEVLPTDKNQLLVFYCGGFT